MMGREKKNNERGSPLIYVLEQGSEEAACNKALLTGFFVKEKGGRSIRSTMKVHRHVVYMIMAKHDWRLWESVSQSLILSECTILAGSDIYSPVT